MKNLTGEMLSLIKSTNSIWQGEAATAYGNKFASLSPDMEKLYRMVNEHVQDLQEMARQLLKDRRILLPETSNR